MAEKQIRLIALDLDGTALTDGNRFAPGVEKAIKKASESGIEIVAASGRPFRTMPREILNSGEIKYIISSNGAAIYENGVRIRGIVLDKSDVLKLLEITKPYDLIFEAFIDGCTYADARYVENPAAYGCSEAYFDYVRSAKGKIENMRKFISENSSRLDSVEFTEQDLSLVGRLRAEAEKSIPGMYVTSSTETFVEFMNKEATKASALRWLCARLKIDRACTAACGNADNDADMLGWAGVGVAVANASKLCSQAADLHVPSNNDGGAAVFIESVCKAIRR